MRILRRLLLGGAITFAAFQESAAVAQTSAPLPKVTIGIGSITNTYDNTSESFDVLAFLKTRPFQVGAAQVDFILIDHPIDADYAISGKVAASYDHKLHALMDRHPGRGQDRPRSDRPGSQVQEPHEFTYTHDLDLTIWKAGRKLGTFRASSDIPHEGIPDEVVKGTVWADNYDGIRTTLLLPAWKELATRLEQQLKNDLAAVKGE